MKVRAKKTRNHPQLNTRANVYNNKSKNTVKKKRLKEMKRKTWKYLTKEMIEEMEIPGKRK